MKGLDFLKKVSLAANEVVKPATARTTVAKDRNPVLADIRIFKNGAAYPSAALVTEFGLNFTAKDAADKGNAFDIFKSADYPNTQAWPEENRVLFIASVPRTVKFGKTDLFSSTGYDETGAPSSDVLTQGAVTFGAKLLEYVKEVYNEEPTEETPYVDLVIVRDSPFNTNDGIYYVPKVISRGEEKGKNEVIRREGLTLLPLVPYSWTIESTEEAVTIEEENVTVEEATKGKK